MIQSISHDEAQALLAIEALGALTGADRDALLAHVEVCAVCSAQLVQLRDTAAALAESLPAVPLNPDRSAAMRSRLLARAASDLTGRRGDDGGRLPNEPPVKAPTSPVKPLSGEPVRAIGRSPASRGGWLAAAAAVLLAAGILSVLRSTRRDAAVARNELTAVRAQQLRAATEVALRDSLIEQLTGATVRIVDLTGSGPKAPMGWVFWDQNEKWTLLVHDLPALAADRTYQLWLTTGGQRTLSAGTFGTDHRGHAVFRATLSLPRDSLVSASVTLEPAGGAARPSGPIALASK